jgi:hypothetical protein
MQEKILTCLETSVFQSLGNCQSQCQASYAFAVVQGQNCWCSNYVPGDQFPISSCETPCPGYPYENCGSTDSNLFGYLALNLLPSGTIAGSVSKAEERIPIFFYCPFLSSLLVFGMILHTKISLDHSLIMYSMDFLRPFPRVFHLLLLSFQF